jgi:hypothetical protein
MPLRNLLLNNLWLKLVALALATLIWFSIHLKVTKSIQPPSSPLGAVSERVFQQHTVFVLTDIITKGGFVLQPTRVTITVKGDIAVVEKLRAEDIQAFVDLTQVAPDVDSLNKVVVHTPSDVTLVQVIPPNVRVRRPGQRP